MFTSRGAKYDKDSGYWSLSAETVANVTLAAAAPDLLEALQELLPGCEAMGWNTKKATAAIAKVKGDES
jgi:hypothetical protein